MVSSPCLDFSGFNCRGSHQRGGEKKTIKLGVSSSELFDAFRFMSSSIWGSQREMP